MLSVLNKFSNYINTIKIFHKTDISSKFYTINTLNIKLIILLINKKNIKDINIPIHYDNKILKYLFKSFIKKSTLVLLNKSLFLFELYASKKINQQNKKLLFKFCRYNKIENYIISIFECLEKNEQKL